MKLTYAVVIEQTPNNYGAYAPGRAGLHQHRRHPR